MLRALLEVWRSFHPSRSEYANATRIRGRFDDPPGHEILQAAIGSVLMAFRGDDEVEQLNHTSGWDIDKGTFRLDVFASDRATLDAAVQALVEDDSLATCDLETEVRWSDGT